MRIFVKTKTNAREEKVEKIDDTNFKVSVTELPLKGRANLAIFKALSQYFKISESSITMISGYKSSHKVFEIDFGK